MGQEKNPINRQSDFWKLFERFGVIIALVASLATVIGLYLQVQSEKRVLELQIISADQLTRLPSVTGLDGKFTYNNIPVTDLWRLRIQFVNSGDATLIGEGTSSSLMTSTIPITFPSGVSILDASSETGSFYKLTQTSENTIEIGFSQWRPSEKFETIIYIASNNILDTPPLPKVSNRPIINGDVQITDLTAKNATEPRPAIDYIPSSIAVVGKILGGIIAIIIGGFSFVMLVIVSPIEYIQAQFWKYKYFDAFRKHLDTLKISKKNKQELLKKPWSIQRHMVFYSDVPTEGSAEIKKRVRKTTELPEMEIAERRYFGISNDIWKDFDGPPAPQPGFETFSGTIAGFIIGIILTASCAAIIASMIIV